MLNETSTCCYLGLGFLVVDCVARPVEVHLGRVETLGRALRLEWPGLSGQRRGRAVQKSFLLAVVVLCFMLCYVRGRFGTIEQNFTH